MINRASNPEYTVVKKRLREQMEKELTRQRDPRTLGEGDVFDRYPYMGKAFQYTGSEYVALVASGLCSGLAER